MAISWIDTKSPIKRASPNSVGNLRFMSTAAMERGLNGDEEEFAAYFFAIYHCSPDAVGGIVERREQLRTEYPDKAISIGQRFILSGEAAYQALAAYYLALIECETLEDNFRTYARERLDAMTEIHRKSQSLPVPIDLTEGQLSQDRRLEFLTCIAIENGQIIIPIQN